MQRGGMYPRALFLAVMALVFAATAQTCRAQGEDGETSDPKLTASLRLTFKSHGQADVYLSLDQAPSDWQPIQAALGQSLHCPPGAFAHPSLNKHSLRNGPYLKPEQVARYEKYANEASQRRLTATCNDVLTASGWTVSGTLSLQPLADSLSHAGVQQLFVSVHRPKSGFEEHSSEGLQAGLGFVPFLNYSYSLEAAPLLPPLHLAYGYRNSDVLRQCTMSAGFLLLPFLLILWMRRAALKDAAQDPTAAWFSYFKTLQWCVNGTMLLWMVAHTSLRQGVQDMVAFRVPDGWQSVIVNTLVTMVPPWFVYLLCLFVSYKVFVQLRGHQSTRREFLLERSFEVGAQFLPLMFFVCALRFLITAPKAAVLLMLAAYFSRVLCLRGKIRVSRATPEALTTGELRDRVFELAKRAGVKIKQVFVLGAGRAQTANAYATGAQTVMFTDYLLQRLTKREVDAIAGHELSHLKCGHPKKLGMTMVGVILLPTIFHVVWGMFTGFIGGLLLAAGRGLAMQWFQWSQKLVAWLQVDLLLLVAGFGVFYLLSRHFERVADEGSAQLVGDPEAMMTALLKVSRLNLTPIQWGKVTGSILTHPTTLKRIEHLAKVGNVSPERVQQLLAHHAQEEQERRAGLAATQIASPITGDEHYAIPSSATNVLSTMGEVKRVTNILWVLVSANVLPPTLVAWTVHKLNLSGGAALAAYVGSAGLILAGYSLLGLWLSLRGRKKLRQQFTAKFGQEGIQICGRNAILAGFAPGDSLRGYLSGYDWDKGFVWLLQNRIVYLGDKLRFALRPEQVVNVRVGQSAPGWWNSERVYLDWHDTEFGRGGTFSLYPNEPSSAGKIKNEGKALCAAVQRWRNKASEYPVAPTTVQLLESPVLGEVTSQDVKDRVSSGKRLSTLFLLLMLSYGASLVLGVSGWYGFVMVLVLRIYERIPYWRHRVPPTTSPLQQPQVARAQATGAR